jgi:hypothetical protein
MERHGDRECVHWFADQPVGELAALDDRRTSGRREDGVVVGASDGFVRSAARR